MIPIPSGVRVWIATGHTDMRRGMQGLAFTDFGIESLIELIKMYKDDPTLLKRWDRSE
jgi:hypothetical protein